MKVEHRQQVGKFGFAMLAVLIAAVGMFLVDRQPSDSKKGAHEEVEQAIAVDPLQLVNQQFPENEMGVFHQTGLPVARHGKVAAVFPMRFSDPLIVRSYKADVSAQPLEANGSSSIERRRDGVRMYREAFPGCDVLYRDGEKRVEEFLIVRESSGATREWNWRLKTGEGSARLKPHLTDMGAIRLMDGKGIDRLYIEPPHGKDADGNVLKYGRDLRYEISELQDDSWRLTLVADLTHKAHPVVIDPTWRAAPRIIDGTNVPESQFPTVGQVGTAGEILCTGTLISSRCVLTAGHCYTDDNGNLTIGQTDGRFILNGTTFSTTQITVHPTYKGFASEDENQFDVTIMMLDQDVPGVTPTPLFRSTPTVGTILTLAGFGEQGTGSGGTNGTFPANGTINTGTTPIDSVTGTFIKWTFENSTPAESNTAPGDSGGPAFITVGSELQVAGVTSGGQKANASFGDQSFDVRVDAVASWIDQICGTSGSGNNSPIFTSRASASKANPLPNEAITLSATASDSDGDTITYTWDFGDSTSGSGASVSKTYTVGGIYTATVTASDGNGGSNTSSVQVVVSDQTMTLLKGLISLDLSGGAFDKAMVTVEFTFPAETTLAGSSVTINVGGVSQTVTLDDEERSTGDATILFRTNGRRKGDPVPAGTFATLKAKIFGDFITDGLVLGNVDTLNTTTDRQGTEATVTVVVVVGSSTFAAIDQLGTYKAKEDKTGKFR